jgi:hypothetical protein
MKTLDLQVKGLHSSENSNDGQEQSATEESIGDKMAEQIPDVANNSLDVPLQEGETFHEDSINFR